MSPGGFLAMCLSVCLSTGCTVVGMGIGAVVDAAVPGPYETRPASAHLSFKPKDRVRVWFGNGQRIDGRYLGVVGPTPRDPETYLIIDADPKPKLVAASQVKSLGVEVLGKGWLYGGLIGLVVDVTLVVIAVVSVNNMEWNLQSNGNHW